MRPLKIVLLSRWYAEEHRRANREGDGQASGTVQELAEAVAALGHEVVVLSQSRDVPALERSRIGALEVWLSPRERRRWGLTAWRDKWAKHTFVHRKVHSDALDLRDFLARRGPFDVLWAQCEEPDGLVAALAARLTPLLPPTLVQIYALRYRFEKGAPIFNQKPGLRLTFRGAARILANSEKVAEGLASYASRSLPADALRARTRLVPHNLRTDFIRAASEPGPSPEPDRVLFLGAWNEKKGAIPFLKAALLSESAKRGATFAMTGGFTEKDRRFSRRWSDVLGDAQIQLPPRQLELLGTIPAAEAITQIRRASVVVIPSLFDECPRALVEALALGRPVITTEQVGNSTLVSQHGAGLVVRANDPTALAAAMDDVLRPDAPYPERARQASPRIREEFSSAAIARQIALHLDEIARP